jgi:hypothetical protein
LGKHIAVWRHLRAKWEFQSRFFSTPIIFSTHDLLVKFSKKTYKPSLIFLDDVEDEENLRIESAEMLKYCPLN